MARKGKEIKIVVHTPENPPAAFHAENMEQFWIEKMMDKMGESRLTRQEWQEFIAPRPFGAEISVIIKNVKTEK